MLIYGLPHMYNQRWETKTGDLLAASQKVRPCSLVESKQDIKSNLSENVISKKKKWRFEFFSLIFSVAPYIGKNVYAIGSN